MHHDIEQSREATCQSPMRCLLDRQSHVLPKLVGISRRTWYLRTRTTQQAVA